MQVPFEIIMGIFALTFTLSIIGVWKKIPVAMFIGGALITFVFLLTDSITALGDTNTCVSTLPDTTTCTQSPYELDVWIKIIFMLLGSVFMIGGALIWKATEE
jgi:hypothetical protein